MNVGTFYEEDDRSEIANDMVRVATANKFDKYGMTGDFEKFPKGVPCQRVTDDAIFAAPMQDSPQFSAFCKYASKKMEKEDTTEYTSLVMNKKLAKTMLDSFKLDLFTHCLPDSTELNFSKDQAELKATCTSMQLSILDSGHTDVNHTAFCMSEARAVISGKTFLCGVKYEQLDGASISDKTNTFASLTLADVSDADSSAIPADHVNET